ncbi:MAG: hypothetical protein KAW14_00120 [Candidatus Aegiribacteria sp.]|nr:hypothetical protein [Candidatus Aegiribacteria sp.]
MTDVDRSFQASWGTLLKVLTLLVIVVLIGVPGWLLLSKDCTATEVVLYSGIPIIILFIALLFTVKGYVIRGNVLGVRRLLWETEIDLSSLVSVYHDSKAMTGSIRTLGNGGLFSFSGKYRSGKLGPFRAFVTDFRNCVVLKLAEQVIVVSPDNPEMFVEILSNIHSAHAEPPV